MFNTLSKDDIPHEVMELFTQIKDKGNISDVISHTVIIEARANSGQSKETLKVYLCMLSSGIMPYVYTYTYTVLITGLVANYKLSDVEKYFLEMMGKEMRPNRGTYMAVFEAFVKEGKEDQCREFL